MSIYSGFATRHQQQTYDQTVCDLIFVLQKRMLKFYRDQPADQDKFFLIFDQLYNHLIHQEKSKYLQPKISASAIQIYNCLRQKQFQRDHCPEEELKKFQKSLKMRQDNQSEVFNKLHTKINTLIRTPSASIGKIKKQIQNSQTNQRSFSNANQASNQQQKSSLKSRIFSSSGRRNSKSYQDFQQQIKNNPQKKGQVQHVVKQYIQKINKNYLRGYRKRKIREPLSKPSDQSKMVY